MSHEETTQVVTGDVIEDSYGNPAVVLTVRDGKPSRIMQVVGSDRGRVGSAPSRITLITNPARVEWARDVARREWKHLGLKRSQLS